MNKVKVSVFTYLPSPYQVELFNTISEKEPISLTVIYLYSHLPFFRNETLGVANFWERPEIKHSHIMLDDSGIRYSKIEPKIDRANLVVFNYYKHPLIAKFIERCAYRKKAWCFWGERPGYHGYGWLSSYYRKWRLSKLYKSNMPIWGIGRWAVEKYRREFGNKRKYFNIPYFSDLARFKKLVYADTDDKTKIFLFSGSLIYRKGIDLLIDAFGKLAKEFSYVRLNVVGDGELRSWVEKKSKRFKDRIQFLGFQSWNDLPAFYKTSHILCAPSRYDGWAMVVPEALAAGLPVISTDCTGAALEFINNKNGWIIPAGNGEELYKVMKHTASLSNSELFEYSQNAERSISSHSLEDGAKRFYATVKNTLNI